MTDRKRAEEALRESEAKWRSITEHSPDHIMLLDRNANILFINHAVPDLTREQVIGTPIWNYVPPEFRPIVKDSLERVLRTGEPARYEVEYRTAEGDTRVFETRVGPVEHSGQIVALTAAARDITERKRAEEALRESESRYRLLAENVTDVIWTMDMNLRLTYVSPSITRSRGYTVEEAIAQTLPEILTPASLEVAMKALAEARAMEEKEQKDPAGSRTLELEHTCKGGSTVWCEVTMTFLRDPDGHAVEILGVSRDITERKRAEEALRHTEQRYRELFEGAPLIYVITRNHDGAPVVADCNELFLTTLGYARAEVLERPLADFYAPQSRAELLEGGGYERALKGDFAAEERQLVTRDGRVVETLLRAVPESAADGHVFGTRAMYVDITERKRADEALCEEKHRAQKYLDVAQVILVSINSGEEVALVNKKGCSVLGYEQEEIVGKNWFDVFLPATIRQEVRAVFRKLMAGEIQPVEYYENPVLTKPGEQRLIAWHNTLLTDEAGNILGTLSSGEDITERKRAEEALRDSEEKFRNIFQSASDGIVYLDTSGVILDVNEKAVELFGGPREEVVGKHFTEVGVFRSADMPTLMANLAGILSGERPNVEVRIKDRKGQERFLDCSGCSLKRDGKTPSLVVVIARDITERKRAEEALQKMRDELESRVERRMQQVNGYGLTFRELTVLHLVAAGESDKEIATVLGISPLTAHKHLANILEKMDAACRTEAGVRALREGLLD
jgi:PAS domain S-box-containing protein